MGYILQDPKLYSKVPSISNLVISKKYKRLWQLDDGGVDRRHSNCVMLHVKTIQCLKLYRF